jgi:hypothetical protein
MQYTLSSFNLINIITTTTTTTVMIIIIISSIILIITSITQRTLSGISITMLGSLRVAILHVILLIRSDPTAFHEVGWTLIRRNSFENRGSNAFEIRKYRSIVDSWPEHTFTGDYFTLANILPMSKDSESLKIQL